MRTFKRKTCRLLLEFKESIYDRTDNGHGSSSHWLLPSGRTLLSFEKPQRPTNHNNDTSLSGPANHAQSRNTVQSSDLETQPVRIMIVDDERDMVTVLRQGLQKKGFEVDAFTDPFEALEQYKPSQYSVVLLDIRMPKMDGIELYKRIRMIDEHVVICFVSAYEQYKQQFEITYPNEKTGCFIPKPFRIDSLASIITSKVGERRQQS